MSAHKLTSRAAHPLQTRRDSHLARAARGAPERQALRRVAGHLRRSPALPGLPGMTVARSALISRPGLLRVGGGSVQAQRNLDHAAPFTAPDPCLGGGGCQPTAERPGMAASQVAQAPAASPSAWSSAEPGARWLPPAGGGALKPAVHARARARGLLALTAPLPWCWRAATGCGAGSAETAASAQLGLPPHSAQRPGRPKQVAARQRANAAHAPRPAPPPAACRPGGRRRRPFPRASPCCAPGPSAAQTRECASGDRAPSPARPSRHPGLGARRDRPGILSNAREEEGRQLGPPPAALRVCASERHGHRTGSIHACGACRRQRAWPKRGRAAGDRGRRRRPARAPLLQCAPLSLPGPPAFRPAPLEAHAPLRRPHQHPGTPAASWP